MNFMNNQTVVLSNTHFFNSFTLSGVIKLYSKVIFIDSQVEDYQNLVSGVSSEAIVVILDGSQDGIKQITEFLGRHHVAEIHIVSHGAPGCLYLGSSQLSLDTLNQYALALSTWSADFILLYGCNVATGDAGTEFVNQLHQLTGADIAASTTLTGNAALDGNWALDLTTGPMQVSLPFTDDVTTAYAHVLSSSYTPSEDKETVINAPTATNNSNSVNEDATVAVTGNVITDNDGSGVDSDPNNDTLTVSEVDGIAVTTATAIIGTYGTLTISDDGSYEYSVDNTNPDVQALGGSDAVKENFTYTVSDGNGGTDTATLTVRVNGVNDTPVAHLRLPPPEM